MRTSFGPIYPTGLQSLPAGLVALHGALVAMVHPRYDPAVLTWPVTVDPISHLVTDSLAVPASAVSASIDDPTSFVVSPDGRRVYLIGFYGIYGFDLLTHRLLNSIRAPRYDTHVAVSPDADRVYLIANAIGEYGVPRTPTTVRVFDADLVEQSPLTFATQFGSNTPVLHDIVVSHDNSSLYLEAGNRDFFGEGMDRVLVMNLASASVVHTIQLGVYGQARLIVGH